MSGDMVNIFWFRRDLRLHDNAGFLAALKAGKPVLPIFIFDKDIVDILPRNDARVTFIWEELQRMRTTLHKEHSSSVAIFYGKPADVFTNILNSYAVDTVFTNRDYETYAQERDNHIEKLLTQYAVSFKTFKDQVIFEKEDVIKNDGDPYVVYTPYKNKWIETFQEQIGGVENLTIHCTCTFLNNCIKNSNLPNVSLGDMDFEKSTITVPEYDASPTLIADYDKTRNFPAIRGTSRLGTYLRFGVVSVRHMVKKAYAADDKTFLSELIWREFFMQILYHFPHTANSAFRPKYNRIEWRNDEVDFEKWKTGTTGYKLVDAGMRELNATGYMHNRVRMLVASFLCKHLLIDWRWGERYFAEKLLDFELASNVGNWQWAAGSGVDAAPYFRIFNPVTQIDKFDKTRKYTNKWVPENNSAQYPAMMVDHSMARERCLKVYKEAVQ